MGKRTSQETKADKKAQKNAAAARASARAVNKQMERPGVVRGGGYRRLRDGS